MDVTCHLTFPFSLVHFFFLVNCQVYPILIRSHTEFHRMYQSISKLLSFSDINLDSEPWINVYWKNRGSHTMKCCLCVGKHIFAKKTIISIHKYFHNPPPCKCLMWSLLMIFRLIFALLTIYYRYHIAIFSSSQAEILILT